MVTGIVFVVIRKTLMGDIGKPIYSQISHIYISCMIRPFSLRGASSKPATGLVMARRSCIYGTRGMEP